MNLRAHTFKKLGPLFVISNEDIQMENAGFTLTIGKNQIKVTDDEGAFLKLTIEKSVAGKVDNLVLENDPLVHEFHGASHDASGFGVNGLTASPGPTPCGRRFGG